MEIKDKVRIRLTGLGFEEYANDIDLIHYFEKLIFDEITTNINWSYIPEKLESVYIDMIAGELLYYYYLKGNLKPETNDLEPGNINSIKAGDVTLGVSSNTLTTSAGRLLGLIDELRNPRERTYLFNIFRRIL